MRISTSNAGTRFDAPSTWCTTIPRSDILVRSYLRLKPKTEINYVSNGNSKNACPMRSLWCKSKRHDHVQIQQRLDLRGLQREGEKSPCLRCSRCRRGGLHAGGLQARTTQLLSRARQTRRPVKFHNLEINQVQDTSGTITGRPTGGFRNCRQVESCRGLQISVRWSDGKQTWPCTCGMEEIDAKKKIWRIMT